MLNFDNASILGYSHILEYLPAGINYRIIKKLSVNGKLTDLSNEDGSSGIWNEASGFLQGSIDNDSVMINGLYFGDGIVNSIKLNPGDDVKLKEYTCDLTVIQSGDFSNVTGSYYSGIDWQGCEFIDKIDESFDFSRAEDDRTSYTHNIRLKMLSGNIDTNPLNLAKVFAKILINASNITGFLGNYDSLPYKKYYSEVYDQQNLTCSIKENVDLSNVSGIYSNIYTHSINIDENGIVTATEDGEIKGLVSNVYNAARSGLSIEMPLVYDRTSNVFSAYVSNDYPLNSNYLTKNIQENRFDGTIAYSIGLSNDKSLQGLYSWTYTQSIDRNESEVYSITEDGFINGFGRQFDDKYYNAYNGWTGIKAGLSGRLYNFYSQAANNPDNNIQITQMNEYKNEFAGTIKYSAEYSDDNAFKNISGIKREQTTISDSLPVALKNEFGIFNNKTIIQSVNNSTIGNRTIDISLIGNRDLGLTGYIAYAKTKLSMPAGNDNYISDCSYRYDKFRNDFSMDIRIQIHSAKAFDSIDLGI